MSMHPLVRNTDLIHSPYSPFYYFIMSADRVQMVAYKDTSLYRGYLNKFSMMHMEDLS